jgi:hypothetical protein
MLDRQAPESASYAKEVLSACETRVRSNAPNSLRCSMRANLDQLAEISRHARRGTVALLDMVISDWAWAARANIPVSNRRRAGR